MMKLVLTFLLTVSSLGFASDFSFTYFGNEGPTRVFLACDYAEYRAEQLLKDLGAENIEINCFGGITPIGVYRPVSLRGSFDFPEESAQVNINSRDYRNHNCYFDTRFMRYLTREFEDNLEVTDSRSYCFDSSTDYTYEINVN